MQLLFTLFSLVLCYSQMLCLFSATPGDRMWDMIQTIGTQTCTTESATCILESLVDTTATNLSCAPTPINNLTFTIVTSGSYCLSENLTHGLQIGANNITIDLNGHSITGSIFLGNTVSNIVIKNGIILDGDPGPFPGSYNPCINGFQFNNNIVVCDVIIAPLAQAMRFDQCQNVSISRCYCKGGTTSITFITCNDITIHNCIFANTSGAGVFIRTNSNRAIISHCFAYGSNFSAIDSNDIRYEQSAALASNGSGFTCNVCNRITVTRCIACNNQLAGFSNLGTQISVEHCIAKHNGQGFSFQSGAAPGTPYGIARENLAESNDVGFVADGNPFGYVANAAITNTINYNTGGGSPFFPVAPSAATSYWNNISA